MFRRESYVELLNQGEALFGEVDQLAFAVESAARSGTSVSVQRLDEIDPRVVQVRRAVAAVKLCASPTVAELSESFARALLNYLNVVYANGTKLLRAEDLEKVRGEHRELNGRVERLCGELTTALRRDIEA
jgi:hypothetical protein